MTAPAVAFRAALARFTDALSAHGCAPKVRGDHIDARCPAHDDHKPSLSADWDNGKMLVCCQTGCSNEDITAALGMTMADLYDEPKQRGTGTRPARSASRARRSSADAPAPKHGTTAPTDSTPECDHDFRPVAQYTYTDAEGTITGWVSRKRCEKCGEKRFGQSRPGANGKREFKAPTERPLYRLPDVLAAIADGTEVVVVEGEKDADNGAAAGLVTTTNAMGAEHWSEEHTETLRGAHVVIVADRDVKGYRHAVMVRDALNGVAASVRVVRGLVAKVKADLSDHLAAGHSPADLEEIDPAAELAALEGPAADAEPTDVPAAELPKQSRAQGLEGIPSLHPVAITNSGFYYSHGPGNDCDDCDTHGVRRGVYFEPSRFMSELPHVKARVIQSAGKKRETFYLLAETPEGRGAVLAPEDVELGKWSSALTMTRSADRKVKDAVASVIFTMGKDAPIADYALSPTSRTGTGHIPQPIGDCLPQGYWERPEGLGDEQLLENNRELARQVARSPKMALLDGAAVGGVFGAALGELSSVWNPYGNPRQGKTTMLMAGCCNSGNPGTDSNPVAMVNLNSTKLGANQALGEVGLLSVFFNESGTADFTPQDWAQFIFSATGGNRRAQSAKYGAGRNLTPGWSGTAFISGNARVADGLKGSRFAGIAARLIEIPAPLTLDADHAEAIERLVPRSYGYVMPQAVKAFTVEQAAKFLEQARRLLGMPEGGTLRTVAKALSIGVMGAMMKDAILGTGTLLTDAALLAAREHLDGHPGDPESEAEQVLDALRTDLVADRSAWLDEAAYLSLGRPRDADGLGDTLPVHGYNRHTRGYVDDTYVYVLNRPTSEERSTWEALCEATGADSATALRQLFERGHLKVAESVRKRGKFTSVTPRWAGQISCYRVLRASLATGEDDPAASPQGPQDGPVAGPGPAGPAEPPQAATDAPICRGCKEPMTAGDIYGNGLHMACDAPAEPDPTGGWGEGTLGAEMYAEETAHQRPADPSPVPAPRPAPAPRPSAPASAVRPAKGGLFDRAEQEQAYRERVAVLDAMDPADDSDETVNRAASALRIVEAMTDDPGGDSTKDGPFAPVKFGTQAPFWTAPLPDIAPPMVAHNGWGNFTTPSDYRGLAAILDRNASHPSALSSLRVAHGRLEPTGALSDARRPGYYKTVVQPWNRTDLPSPMGTRPVGAEAWITAERMRLLEELAKRGPKWWVDAPILDSRTAERECSLRDLSQLIKHLRAHVIDTHGKDSAQWETIKEATNTKLIQILMGSPNDDGPWTDRKWYTKCRRTDWAHALHDKAAMNLFRVADKLSSAGIPVLAVRHMDEIVIPADRVDDATSRGLIKADENGSGFGTFKTKDTEEWGD